MSGHATSPDCDCPDCLVATVERAAGPIAIAVRVTGDSEWRPLPPLRAVDEEPEPAPKPCSARMKHGGWCLLAPDHQGPHAGIPRGELPKSDFGPRRKR